MPDWQSSMQRTYEFYTVDPGTWKDVALLDTVKSASFSRDSSAETLGSATIDATESAGETYIRGYLVVNQNGVKSRHPLGTVLAQTPSSDFNGKVKDLSMDAYTPLLELKENQPPIGYYIPKNNNIMEMAYRIVRENTRAPVVRPDCEETLKVDFVANTDDTWLSFVRDLIDNANYELALDEWGRILFSPKQDVASLQPVWTYNDDNSSILYPEVTMDHDLFGIPNVVEVVYSRDNEYIFASVVNDDPNSPTSTVSRGRKITYRDSNPTILGNPTQYRLDEYAKQLLRDLSSVELTVSYTHGYCPVRLGDCVRLNYTRAGFSGIKAKVISQSIQCNPACQVTEKAVFTAKLWGGSL